MLSPSPACGRGVGVRAVGRSVIGASIAEARSTASARERADYFCFGKSNQNHSLLTRAAATRRCPALLAEKGTSPELATLRFAQTAGDSSPFSASGARLALSRWRIKNRRQKARATTTAKASKTIAASTLSSRRKPGPRPVASGPLPCRFHTSPSFQRKLESIWLSATRPRAVSYRYAASPEAPPSTRSARRPRPSAAPASRCRGRTRTAGSPKDRSGRGSRNPCAASGRTR